MTSSYSIENLLGGPIKNSRDPGASFNEEKGRISGSWDDEKGEKHQFIISYTPIVYQFLTVAQCGNLIIHSDEITSSMLDRAFLYFLLRYFTGILKNRFRFHINQIAKKRLRLKRSLIFRWS